MRCVTDSEVRMRLSWRDPGDASRGIWRCVSSTHVVPAVTAGQLHDRLRASQIRGPSVALRLAYRESADLAGVDGWPGGVRLRA